MRNNSKSRAVCIIMAVFLAVISATSLVGAYDIDYKEILVGNNYPHQIFADDNGGDVYGSTSELIWKVDPRDNSSSVVFEMPETTNFKEIHTGPVILGSEEEWVIFAVLEDEGVGLTADAYSKVCAFNMATGEYVEHVVENQGGYRFRITNDWIFINENDIFVPASRGTTNIFFRFSFDPFSKVFTREWYVETNGEVIGKPLVRDGYVYFNSLGKFISGVNPPPEGTRTTAEHKTPIEDRGWIYKTRVSDGQVVTQVMSSYSGFKASVKEDLGSSEGCLTGSNWEILHFWGMFLVRIPSIPGGTLERITDESISGVQGWLSDNGYYYVLSTKDGETNGRVEILQMDPDTYQNFGNASFYLFGEKASDVTMNTQSVVAFYDNAKDEEGHSSNVVYLTFLEETHQAGEIVASYFPTGRKLVGSPVSIGNNFYFVAWEEATAESFLIRVRVIELGLEDVIRSLQVTAGIPVQPKEFTLLDELDVVQDGRIDMRDVIFLLQREAGL